MSSCCIEPHLHLEVKLNRCTSKTRTRRVYIDSLPYLILHNYAIALLAGSLYYNFPSTVQKHSVLSKRTLQTPLYLIQVKSSFLPHFLAWRERD
jgi:hypothetical protein